MKNKIIITALSLSLVISVAYNIHQKNIIKKFKEPIKKIVNIDDDLKLEIAIQEQELFDIRQQIQDHTCNKKRTEQNIHDINCAFYRYPCSLYSPEQIKEWEQIINSKYKMDDGLKNRLEILNRKNEKLDSIIGKLNIRNYFLTRDIMNKKASTYSQFSNHFHQLKLLVQEKQQ